MIERITDSSRAKQIAARLNELLLLRAEWLCAVGPRGRTFALRRDDCDFHLAQGQLLFTCLGDEGSTVWRVLGWEWTGAKLLLEVSRRAERAWLELTPRARASAVNELVSASRRTFCQRLAQMACERLARDHFIKVEIERAGLSSGQRPGQPGRYARIILRTGRERMALTGIVEMTKNEPGEIDALLSSALIWFARLREAPDGSAARALFLVLQSQMLEAAQQRLSLLREDVRRAVRLYRVEEEWLELERVALASREQLWKARAPRLSVVRDAALSQSAARILAQAPEAIDVIRTRHGETLRFHGLPFARVRRWINREQVWFGAQGAGTRRLLDQNTQREWANLLSELKEHRRAEAADRRHAFYRAVPEAWLESILRRDITRLDPGLVIAPLHAQFRASRAVTSESAQARGSRSRPVDLLALRRDGRLVVIELKVSEDREHVLQGADYWLRVETQRRCGQLAAARLFGDSKIADAPPLVYLVAPLLRFHRAFRTLVQLITPEIEIYSFALNEDWRRGPRVLRRETLTN